MFFCLDSSLWIQSPCLIVSFFGTFLPLDCISMRQIVSVLFFGQILPTLCFGLSCFGGSFVFQTSFSKVGALIFHLDVLAEQISAALSGTAQPRLHKCRTTEGLTVRIISKVQQYQYRKNFSFVSFFLFWQKSHFLLAVLQCGGRLGRFLVPRMNVLFFDRTFVFFVREYSDIELLIFWILLCFCIFT